MFNAGNRAAAEKLLKDLEPGIENWRSQVDSLGNQVQADSGRFEIKQLPGNENVEDHHFTSMVSNNDKTVQFAYIIRKYPNPEPRTFEDARGMVINDYQNDLENKWIAELEKKYPVRVEERVFGTLK
jgi:peptidyl-prolyl cis-trans isomerase SurA